LVLRARLRQALVRSARAAIRSWQTFANEGALHDPWLAIADFRVGQCQNERVEVLGRAAQLRPGDGDDVDLGEPTPKDPSLWPVP
jgi:hypothetical protein